MHVAVVGAGPGGLAAAQALTARGHRVAVFDGAPGVGGSWRTPMYASLRCNLPAPAMAFGGAADRFEAARGAASFVARRAVLAYLEAFCERHALRPLLRLNTRVCAVAKRPDSGWTVRVRGDSLRFDAVVVANGHYNKPFVPVLPGIHRFTGPQLHSMAYNEPLQYSGKRVLVVGSKSSGTDLAREIASVAQSVFVSDRSLACENQATYGNIHHMPAINHFTDTGVVFNTGTRSDSIEIDAIVWCTGFLYDFPFLNTTESVSNDGDDGDEDDDGARVSPTGRYVQNLYQHVFSIKDQTLAFIGLPYTVIPFPLMELQSQWIASVWSNHTQLPSKQEQRLWLKNDMQSAATLRHKDLSSYHFMGALQWDYFRFLIESARLNDTNQRLEYFKMLQEIWNHVGTTRPVYPGGPDVYRENIYTINYNDFTWTVSTQKGALQ